MRYLLIMKRRIFVFSIALLVFISAQAQDRAAMNQYQNQLQQLFEQVRTAPTDNQRYHANEQALQLMEEALMLDDSFKWKWNLSKYVSVLTASDGRFRVITWPVMRDNGEYECFGYFQSYNEKEEVYDVYALHDKTEEIINREESLLGPDNWLGMVYQELIVTSHEGRNYYTLLGWNGCDNLTQRKVIEPVTFRPSSSAPQFGQALFRKDKNSRRVILEYKKDAMVNLRYEQQLLHTKVNKRMTNKKGKPYTVQEIHDEKVQMIIFDEVQPQIAGMEGLFQYYIPTGTEMAYVFNSGKWELHNNAQGRVDDEKLNKEFAPLEKKAPSYQTIKPKNKK